jgi:glycosyltransferase involved in cell wall biosynthesis
MSAPISQRQILIVSYLFPPAGGISVQRVLSLARYLPEQGLEVHVLSAWNPTTPTIDRSLLQQVPASVRVHRTFTPEVPFQVKRTIWRWLSPTEKARQPQPRPANPSSRTWKERVVDGMRKLFSPDPEVVWVPFALRRARKLIKRYRIGSVIVTAPPFSALLIGIALQREFPGIQLISDFRDDWLRFFLGTFDFLKGSAIRLRAVRIEREAVERSSRIVTVTPSLQQEMRGRYPDLPPGKFICIPNGFDPALFTGFQSRRHAGSNVVVTYVGTVYSTTSARYYLDALDCLPDPVRTRVETRFIGRIEAEERVYLQNRKSQVTEVGFVPQSEALRLMEETDILLVTMLDPTATSGKVYEYLPTGKPILAVAVEGELPQLIRETRAGWCVDPRDHARLVAFLGELFDPARRLWSEFRPDHEAIRRYERPRLVSMFAGLVTPGAGQVNRDRLEPAAGQLGRGTR